MELPHFSGFGLAKGCDDGDSGFLRRMIYGADKARWQKVGAMSALGHKRTKWHVR